jgi:hypothetical protein
MRESEYDDLSSIGGIGKDFLVTCQGSIEADFASGLIKGEITNSGSVAPKDSAIF